MKDLIINMRHYRIIGMSSFEILLTILLVFIFLFLTYQFKNPTPTFPQLTVLAFVYLIAIFVIGIITHYIFNVNTQLNYWLGLSKCPPDYNSFLGIFNCQTK